MIHWSILSDLIISIDGSSHSDMISSLTVKPLDYQYHKRLYHNLKTNKDLTTYVILEGDKERDEYFDSYNCDTKKLRAKPGNFIGLSYVGQSDLPITYYGLPHVWYTPGGSRCRVCYPTSKESNCTLTRSH